MDHRSLAATLSTAMQALPVRAQQSFVLQPPGDCAKIQGGSLKSG